ETVPASAIAVGDTSDVAAGEEVAADGVGVRGRGDLKRALRTGEAEPVEVETGDRVEAGTVLVDGNVSVRVLAVGKDTVLRRMAAQLESAADRGVKPTTSDRIAPLFTAATLLVAAPTVAGCTYAEV